MITLKSWENSGKDFTEYTKDMKLPIEIDEDLYTYFLEVLPPEEMGKDRFTATMKSYFLVGEASSTVNNRNVYGTYGQGKPEIGGYWFLGYCHKKSVK